MTRREELEALAARVEALTGACPETVARVWCVLHGKKYADHNEPWGTSDYSLVQVSYTEPPKRTRLTTGKPHNPHQRNFTNSLDAAMTLAPEGWRDLRFEKGRDGIGCFLDGRDTFATTPALALTAAALRAIAAQEQPA